VNTAVSRGLLERCAPIPLRLIVGYGFLTHGLLKLGRGVDVFAAALGGLGVPAPHTVCNGTGPVCTGRMATSADPVLREV